jgi:benzoate-CoA ligase family protein
MRASASPDLNLARYYLFDRLDEGLGDKTAILFGDQQHSYADVASKVRSLSGYAISAGHRREERVLIALQDSPAFVWSFFASLRIGGVVAMGNPGAPPADLEHLVRYTRPTLVITHPSVALSIADALNEQPCQVVLVRAVSTGGDVLSRIDTPRELNGAIGLAEALEKGDEAIDSGGAWKRHTKRDDPAIWLFTSGSSGESKAAMHSHRDFAFNTERYAVGTVGYAQDDITVSVPRLYFGYATGTNLMFPFRVGATTGLFSERATPETLGRAIDNYRPTVITNVPTMMAKLLDDDDARQAENSARLDMSQVRFHLSAGEALPPRLLERFMERFGGEVYDGIGSAEMFHIYCTNRPGDVKPGSLGRLVDGYEIKLLPEDAAGPGSAEVNVGETGVMWVRGDSVAHGYYQDRDKSWKTFFGHWCRTGDLFRRDADGYFWFEGRADDLLKVGGVWVAPLEVEDCLMNHAAVSSVAVIGARLDGLVKPKAFVVLRDERRDDRGDPDAEGRLASELKRHVQAELSKHKYPRWIVFVDELPKNDRGKIDRKKLKADQEAGHAPEGY